MLSFELLGARRFAPLFITQFLGALNDNLYRTAMTFLVVYSLMAHDPKSAATLATLGAGVFILPFFLFSAMAGQLADVHDKAWVARGVKIAEVAIMLLGAWALTHDSVALLLSIVFLMGIHSTFFGPMKYAILPQHLGPQEILAGTGLVEAGTFLAILAGQILGGLLATPLAAGAVLGIAILGLCASFYIPSAPPLIQDGQFRWNLAHETWRLMQESMRVPILGATILAISWFWALGAVLTALFAPLVRQYLLASQNAATLFLTAFSIGIALGSLLANRFLRGQVSARYAPVAALIMGLALCDCYFAIRSFSHLPETTALRSLAEFLHLAPAWRVLADLTLLAMAGGVYSVPLYALLQTAAPAASRSRVIAANNVMNSLFMVIATALLAGLLSIGQTLPSIILTLGISTLFTSGVVWLGFKRLGHHHNTAEFS